MEVIRDRITNSDKRWKYSTDFPELFWYWNFLDLTFDLWTGWNLVKSELNRWEENQRKIYKEPNQTFHPAITGQNEMHTKLTTWALVWFEIFLSFQASMICIKILINCEPNATFFRNRSGLSCDNESLRRNFSMRISVKSPKNNVKKCHNFNKE